MSRWQDIPGFFDHNDVIEYRRLVAEAAALEQNRDGYAYMAEVGSYAGRSTVSIARQCGDCRIRLLCVDTWKGSPEHQSGVHCIVPTDSLYHVFVANMVDAGLLDVVVPLAMPSVQAAAMLAGKYSLSLVFLDANHSYESVREDIDAWRGLLRPGGILCGHDWNWRLGDGVRRAVKDRLTGWEVCSTGAIWSWRNT